MKVEFKIKQDHKNWEETPIHNTVDFDSDTFSLTRTFAYDLAHAIVQKHHKEVRFNIKGFPQGYYVDCLKTSQNAL